MATSGKGQAVWQPILDGLLGNNFGYTKPGTLWIGLFSSSPSEAGGTEAPIGRVSMANDSSHWAFTSPNTMKNVQAVTFPPATQPGYNVSGFGIWDSSSGGTLIYFGAIFSTSIAPGDSAIFQPNSLVVTED